MTMHKPDTVAAVQSQTATNADALIALSHSIALQPELAYEEHHAAAACADLLESRGFAVERGAYGLPTSFAARLGDGGTHVVICAEYDALPGVGHACGHNIIAASAVGAGLALAPLAADAGLRVTVLGTPAEERYGGKIELINAGAFADADVAIMMHPTPYDDYGSRALAVEEWEVVFSGQASHASAEPQFGRNALDGLVQAYTALSMLRQQLRPMQQYHCTITHGGDAPNIIPERAEALYYLRAIDADDLADLRQRVRSCFDGAALATGTGVDVTVLDHPFLPLRPVAGLVQAFSEACDAIGRPFTADPRGDGIGGSTDFGNVSQIVPGLHADMSVHSWPAVNHQHEFAAQCITAEGDATMLDGASALALTALAVATDPGLAGTVG